MRVEPLSGSCGAILHDVDFARLDDARAKEIRAVLLERCVVFFRDQDLAPAQFMDVARRFGTPVEYPFVHGISGFPEIIEVAKLEHEKTNFGGIWHSDTTYLEEPPMGSMLLAREVPPQGGDTIFANQYLAYEALSDGMKRMLDGLRALSSSAKADVTKTREDRMRDRGRYEGKQVYEALHPFVRTHPETGRKALYFDPGKILRIDGLAEAESDALIQELTARMIRPEGEYRHRWRKGDVVIWDNRCSYHKAAGDYPPEEDRIHWRVSIKEK
jgi:taurine dioxygenase